MKKLYLLLAGLLVAGAANAKLTFYYGNQEIEPNTTITFNEIEKTVTGDGIEVVMAPELYIVSSMATTGKLSVTATCTSGQSIQMCCGSLCADGPSVTKSNLSIDGGQKLPLEFEYIGKVANEADIPTVITTFEAKHNSNTATFTLVMNGQNASLTLIENTKPVRYTPAGLEYSLDGHGVLALYDITGRQVLSVAAEGAGTVNTHSLHTGLYIYSLRTSDGGRHTGKIYVK